MKRRDLQLKLQITLLSKKLGASRNPFVPFLDKQLGDAFSVTRKPPNQLPLGLPCPSPSFPCRFNLANHGDIGSYR